MTVPKAFSFQRFCNTYSLVCLFVILYFYPAAWSPKGYGSDLSLPLKADDLFLQVYPFPTPGLLLFAA